MRRSPFVIAGTLAGVAGILSFHTGRGHLVLPTSAGTPTGSSPSTTSPTTPATGSSPAGPSAGGSTTTTTAPAAPAGGARTATGHDVTYPYGDLSVSVTVTGTRITGVKLVTLNDNDSRSAAIDQYSTPILGHQILAAGNLQINGVSGATYTSQAYVDSVQSALDQLGVK